MLLSSNAKKDVRAYWNVTYIDATTNNKERVEGYRSRCLDTKGVREQFKKKGHKVLGVGKA